MTKDGYGFISHSNPQTLNLYTYCGNNPVNHCDPTGHSKEIDSQLDMSEADKEKIAELGYLWQIDEANRASYEAQADAIRAPYIADLVQKNLLLGSKGIHTDYDLNGNRYIHHEQSDLRFNRNGEIVEHNGKVTGPATGAAAKVLQYLKNVRPNFFIEGPGIFVIPPDWQDMFYPGGKRPST